MSADTSTASTPVSNPIACTAATGVGRGGDEGRSNIDGDLGNSHACVCIICSQDIYMHFKNPVPDSKSENIVGDRGCRGAAPSRRPLPRIVFVSRALEVAC